MDLDSPSLDDADHHHFERVLRLVHGAEMTVSDGAGRWRRCRFGNPLEVIGPIEREDRPQPEITVAFALVKGNRPEWAVQKLTELGVDRIAPFTADRSVVQWDDAKLVRQHERLAKVAREAAMQSRQVWLPTVEPLRKFDEVAVRDGAVLADRGGRAPNLRWPVLLVGPEGGWSDRERAAGLATVGLGPTVLRAETATIVGGAAMCGLRSALFESVDGHGG